MIKKSHFIIKASIMILAIILLSAFMACTVNDIKLEDLSLNSNFAQVTGFQIKDYMIYYTNESMAIGYCGLYDNNKNGMIINPHYNIIDSFQIENEWIYFWASKTELCKVNLSDHSIMKTYQIDDITGGEYSSLSWIIYNSRLYYIHYEHEMTDVVNVVNLDNMSCSQVACKKPKRIIQIYDRFLYVETQTLNDLKDDNTNTLVRIDMQSNDIENVIEIEPNAPSQVRGEYLITVQHPSNTKESLYIQKINGARKKE